MHRQHRAAWEAPRHPHQSTTSASAADGPHPAGEPDRDDDEPPIEIDDSVDLPVKDDQTEDADDASDEVRLISYLGDLPSPTDPAFDVFGTIMLPDAPSEAAPTGDDDE